MKEIFLESHNIKNPYSGFGQFNRHLINGLAANDLTGLDITLHAKDIKALQARYGNSFTYKKYKSLTRHKPFRIKKKYNLWHCLNQNIKVEPFYKIPYLLTVHDIHFTTEGSQGLQQKLRAQFNKKLQRATAITYISQFAKKDTHQHFKVPEVPEYVIYNGNTITDVTLPDTFVPNMVPKQPYLFSIGDFSQRKNFISLVEMLRYLPEHQLVLAGNNESVYADTLRNLIAQYELANRVHLPGKIGDDEKKYYLKNCEAFVFPSLREGFGIPPIEAMRFGKPVFLSNNTSLPEIGGSQSFYWDHYEPVYMASVFQKGMETYFAHQTEYEEWYIARAKSFNWKDTAKQYLDVYQTILK